MFMTITLPFLLANGEQQRTHLLAYFTKDPVSNLYIALLEKERYISKELSSGIVQRFPGNLLSYLFDLTPRGTHHHR